MNRNFDRIFWGLILICGGALVLFSRYTGFQELNLFSIILTIILLAAMFKSLLSLDFTGILVPLAFLIIIHDDFLNLRAITPWPVLLAALLTSLGLNLIFPKSTIKKRMVKSGGRDNHDQVSQIYLKAIFNSSVKTVATMDFQEAWLECNFAALQVHFNQAQIQTGPAIINVDVSFGGVELYLPKSWRVTDRTSCTFGAVEQKNSSESGFVEVIVQGHVSFGGVEIIYV